MAVVRSYSSSSVAASFSSVTTTERSGELLVDVRCRSGNTSVSAIQVTETYPRSTRRVPWRPGEVIVRREVWHGRPWAGLDRAGRRRDDAGRCSSRYMPEGTPLRLPGRRLAGRAAPLARPLDAGSGHGVLALQRPGDAYAVFVFWEGPERAPRRVVRELPGAVPPHGDRLRHARTSSSTLVRRAGRLAGGSRTRSSLDGCESRDGRFSPAEARGDPRSKPRASRASSPPAGAGGTTVGRVAAADPDGRRRRCRRAGRPRSAVGTGTVGACPASFCSPPSASTRLLPEAGARLECDGLLLRAPRPARDGERRERSRARRPPRRPGPRRSSRRRTPRPLA